MNILWLINEGMQSYLPLCGKDNNLIVNSQADYNSQIEAGFKGIDAILIQVDLDWGDSDLPFSGIRLVQQLRAQEKVFQPVVFLSFSYSREDILYSNPSLDIISTFGLGNGFCRKTVADKKIVLEFALPVDIKGKDVRTMREYINLLPEVDANRIADCKYYCKRVEQISQIKHDIPYCTVEQTQAKLRDLLGDSEKISGARAQEELRDLCVQLIGEEDLSLEALTTEKRLKLLLLDDKHDTDEDIRCFLTYVGQSMDVMCCKTVDEATEGLKSFSPDVVLVDLRLQDSSNYPVLNKSQGYDYIEFHKENHPTIGLIVLSKLPLAFLRELSVSLKYFRSFYWKQELKNPVYREILKQSIVELAEICSVSRWSQKKKFKKWYKYWYLDNGGEEFQSKWAAVDKEAKRIIDLIEKGGIFFEKDRGGIGLKKTEFNIPSLQSEWRENEHLKNLFVFRRVATYLFYYLDKELDNGLVHSALREIQKVRVKGKLESKDNLRGCIAEAVNRWLAQNWYTDKNSVGNRRLYLVAKSGKIISYKDISMTKIEERFFAMHYRDFYKAWNV